MRALMTGNFRLFALLSTCLLAITLAGCEGDDGAPGADGVDGAAGIDGFSCWDLNENGVADPDEDLNGDGVVDTQDCNAYSSGAYESVALHKGYFSDHPYEGTGDCLNCHGLIGEDMIASAHFKWQGVTTTMAGVEGLTYGKNQIINNFCVAVPGNEGRCTQCHTGYGYADNTYDFTNVENVDCLVCHDQTGDYAKAPTTAGLPVETLPDGTPLDLNKVAQSVGENGGVPTIDNCIDCHAKAGGGDNVKHGDLAMALANTTREYDVHMGTDGGDFECTACHNVKKAGGEAIDHGIGGMVFHSTDEGSLKSCIDCHGNTASIHAGSSVQAILDREGHSTLACQVCHIPTFARDKTTKTLWKWSDAGDVDRGVETDANGDPVYDPKKGSFVWENNVRPTLKYYDGNWSKTIIGVTDQYTSLPAVLAEPTADYTTAGAMIYPFKKMIGNQPADANNNTILVPHLFGPSAGPNAYWKVYDWNLALAEGAAYAGQTYTGEYEFVDTVMYLTVNHEIAPSEQALGYEGACGDCHTNGQYDWTELGWTDDPVLGGTRP